MTNETRRKPAAWDDARREMIWVCKKLAHSGVVAAGDGNVSCRLEEDRFLITPSGRPKAELAESELIVVDGSGSVLEGAGKPSSEIRMHLLVYDKRPDIRAVVHAHPPLLTAMTLARVSFQSAVFPEVWVTVGPVPTAPYATPSTEEVPKSIEPFVEAHHAFLLERHGSLTLGKTLREAYYRLEKLEHAAKCLLAARIFGGGMPEPIPQEKLDILDRIFRK